MHQILHGGCKQTVLPHPFTVGPGNISGALQQGSVHEAMVQARLRVAQKAADQE